MRVRLCTLLALAIALLALGTPLSASAFGTINRLGQNSEHERITRNALTEFQPLTLDQLAGKSGTFGAVGAPDNPRRGLGSATWAHCDEGDYDAVLDRLVGYPQTQAEARETLEACRKWIFDSLKRAVDQSAPLADPTDANTALACSFIGDAGALDGSDKCAVLKSLGEAFHAAQDFYSHSNWADHADPARAINSTNPPGLGHAGIAPWLNPRSPGPFPKGLVTGCFEIEELVAPGRACTYEGKGPGGAGQTFDRIKHYNLNKDKGVIGLSGGVANGVVGTTPRGKVPGNFKAAVDGAIADTIDKWAYVKSEIVNQYGAEPGSVIICVIVSDDYHDCLRRRRTVTPPAAPLTHLENAIEVPPTFCSQYEQATWLRRVYWPYHDRLAAAAGEAIDHSARLERAYNDARYHFGEDSRYTREALAAWRAYDPALARAKKVLADAVALHDVAAAPERVVPCDQPSPAARPQITTPAPATTPTPPPPTRPACPEPPRDQRVGFLGPAIIDELNQARTDPAAYAQRLTRGSGSPSAIAEARAFLQSRMPVPPLERDSLLEAAAKAHADDLAASGQISHTGSDGSRPLARAQKAGLYAMIVAEELSVGQSDPAMAMSVLIVDESSPTRAHRQDLFDPTLKRVGVACAGRAVCVIDMSSTPVKRMAPPGC